MTDAGLKKKRIKLGCIGLALGATVAFGVWAYKPLMGARALGLFEKTEMRNYEGGTMDNLRAIHTAMSLYHESEGYLPPGEIWMDAIFIYMKSADLSEEETEKKLRDPSLGDDEADAYGFAMNGAVAGKFYLEDGSDPGDPEGVADPGQTVLVFTSTEKQKNAYGDPGQIASENAVGVTVDGTVGPIDLLLGR